MNFHLIKSYLKHQIKAKDEHSLHSPFVFEFYNECLKNRNQFYCFDKIENERKKLLQSDLEIDIKDFGAGSTINKSNKRKVKDIAKNSLKQRKLAQQLFRVINYLNPKNIVELGTSLGLTTSYLANATEQKINTFEGCENTLKIAQKTSRNLELNNINFHLGEFSSTFKSFLDSTDSIDFAFIDGNHQYQPTIEYFEWIKAKSNENTCMIFDDIYWSKGMTKAWNEIKNDTDVMISIDTFYFGICFFRKNQPKQHFVLR